MIDRRSFLQWSAGAAAQTGALQSVAAAGRKPVVLTFDDAVRSHRTFVGPYLKEKGFRATFFVTHRWMPEGEQFMSWDEIAELHQMGFEIGNHSWTHANFSSPKQAGRMEAELALVENELARVGVPKPRSFAWCGNGFGPESVRVLRDLGYRFARRGMQPEIAYGKIEIGPAFDPNRHHRLLIPTTGDAYPDWTLDHFRRLLASVPEGRIPVLQFHGVPDVAHPWVHTPPERFREYVAHLEAAGYTGIALEDLGSLLPGTDPADPMLEARYPTPKEGKLELPTEMAATRTRLSYWSGVMRGHGYSPAEEAAVTGETPAEVDARRPGGSRPAAPGAILPYPGGRHTRTGFLNGAIAPMRGTKASLFTPWDPAEYVVVDLPEAIFSNLGLLFLGHTHIPTIWDRQNIVIENRDWEESRGGLVSRWELPNKVSFGAEVLPLPDGEAGAALKLWLENGSLATLTGLRTQVCVLLRGSPRLTPSRRAQTAFAGETAAAGDAVGRHWIVTRWQGARRLWENPPCPCIHSDPVLPDCPAGSRVELAGEIRFLSGRPPGL